MKTIQPQPHLLHTVQNIGLSVVISVSPNTEVDFFRVFIGFERLGDTWNSL
jgi:hypothetical protein